MIRGGQDRNSRLELVTPALGTFSTRHRTLMQMQPSMKERESYLPFRIGRGRGQLERGQMPKGSAHSATSTPRLSLLWSATATRAWRTSCWERCHCFGSGARTATRQMLPLLVDKGADINCHSRPRSSLCGCALRRGFPLRGPGIDVRDRSVAASNSNK